MCHPAFAVAAVVISTAAQMYQSKVQADTENEQQNYESKVMQNNAVIAENNAKQREEDARGAQDQAASEAAKQEMRTRRMISTQTASAASSGLLSTEGSAADLIDQTSLYGKMDADAIRRDGQVQAMGLLSDAANLRQKKSDYLDASTNALWQGQTAKKAGTLSMIGSGLKGAASIAGSYGSWGGAGSTSKVASLSEMNKPSYGWG